MFWNLIYNTEVLLRSMPVYSQDIYIYIYIYICVCVCVCVCVSHNNTDALDMCTK